MDTIAVVLLLIVIAFQVYVSFFKSAGPVGDDKSSALLLEDLRRQLDEAKATAERERTAKGDAQSRASASASALVWSARSCVTARSFACWASVSC